MMPSISLYVRFLLSKIHLTSLALFAFFGERCSFLYIFYRLADDDGKLVALY